MVNKLIIAAAGSGKTTYLVNQALQINDSKVLITTFTEANEREIIKKFIEVNGCVPPNITIQTWFSFLLQHGVRPYQGVICSEKITGLLLVNQKSGLKGYSRNKQPYYYGEKELMQFYFSSSMLIYSDKISKFVTRANELTNGLVIDRLSRIFTHIFIDEVQDLAGYDLELIRLLLHSSSRVLLVGDPRQVTYHTHDEMKYSKYSDGKIAEFINEQCGDCDIDIDRTTLNITYRNKKDICELANLVYPEFDPCGCICQETTEHDGVFFVHTSDVDYYLSKYQPTQLRDNIRTKVNGQYPAVNFGESKGLTFDRVLIYPTKPMLEWFLDHSKILTSPKSRSKLYVAITRARHSVGIVCNKKGVAVKGIQNFQRVKKN